ncbi:hypothetical protein P9112_002699 [Eukaryota sp. TZLM1-RC]
MSITASLVNGLHGHDVNSPSEKESNPPLKESPSSRKNNPSPEESSTLLVENSPPTENNIGDYTYDSNNIFPKWMKLPFGVRNPKLPSKIIKGDGEDTSDTNPPPSQSEEAQEDSSSTTVTSTQTGTSNFNGGTGDKNGGKPPTDPSNIHWTDTEYRTSQEWYRPELQKRVAHTVRYFFQSIIVSPPDDIRD